MLYNSLLVFWIKTTFKNKKIKIRWIFRCSGGDRQLSFHLFLQVEIQVFGPFTAGRKHVYVAVALDCYSQFPEAMVMENISAATLTTFVVNLICRYFFLIVVSPPFLMYLRNRTV